MNNSQLAVLPAPDPLFDIEKMERERLTSGNETASLRFWSKVDVTTDCWNWSGCLTRGGYGHFNAGKIGPVRGQLVYAHRWSYTAIRGPIPFGLELDHLCRNPRCVNPDHLEAVLPRVNVLRSQNTAAINARKMHCPAGHPLSGDNLYLNPKGSRECRTCRRQQSQQRSKTKHIL